MTSRAPSSAPIFIGNHPAERLQRRRVTHEHEQAEQPEHPKQAKIQRIHPVQIPGQKREQVDDHKQATVSKRVAKHINFNNLMP